MQTHKEMREVEIFTAEDGREFLSKIECRDYETKRARQQNSKIEENLLQFQASDLDSVIFDETKWYYVYSENDVKAIADVMYGYIKEMPTAYPTWVGVASCCEVEPLDKVVKELEDYLFCLNGALEHCTPKNDTVMSVSLSCKEIKGTGNGFSMAEVVDCDD